MNIKRASIKDAEEIYELQRRAFKQEAEFYGDFNTEPLTVTMEQTGQEFLYCKKFELYTGYRSKNNQHLYKKFGYKVTKTIMLNEKTGLIHMEK